MYCTTTSKPVRRSTHKPTSMASPSNINTSSPTEKYPYPTEFNVLDFVPKLSERNYKKWKSLMLGFIKRRGLTGFIDGTAEEVISNQEYYCKAWKKSDNLVQEWILVTLAEDTRPELLKDSRLETAKDFWTLLELLYYPTSFAQYDEEEDNRLTHYLPLHKAVVKGDLNEVMSFIQLDPGVVRIPITVLSETALHVAVKSSKGPGRNDMQLLLLRKLLENMTRDDVVRLVNNVGRTALHDAAFVGTVEDAEMLVNKSPIHLPHVLDTYGATALHIAAQFGRREMALKLHEFTSQHILTAETSTGSRYLWDLISGELYDIALTVIEKNPELARANISPSALEILAKKGSSFPSGNSFNFWQKLIYLGVPIKSNRHNGEGRGREDVESTPTNCSISVWQRLHFMFWEVAEKLVPHIKCIQEKKLMHIYALELVKVLCREIAKLKYTKAEGIFRQAMTDATRLGIPEIIEEIVLSFPTAIYFLNSDGGYMLNDAILWRRERVFNLIYQITNIGTYLVIQTDRSLNNGLHLAAFLGREQQINLKASVPVAVLQMQRELQWFKEVEKFTPPFKEKRNADGMTPAEVFSNTHQDLIKEAEHWMKDTATSCTIVAALIAAMVFAATITVPGGNNNENGHPVLSKQNAFVIFGISDALALFSSITSVLMFLLILTSRYAEKDFLHTLPNRLIIGLRTLYVSILSTMIASGAILYLVLGYNKTWVLIPIVALAGIPATLFGVLQFPLLVEMIQSTYGQGIFGKKSDRVLI